MRPFLLIGLGGERGIRNPVDRERCIRSNRAVSFFARLYGAAALAKLRPGWPRTLKKV